MATPGETMHETAAAPADPGLIHADLQSLAARVQGAARGGSADPRELQDLARRIDQVRRSVRGRYGEELRHWLENLQRQVDDLRASARPFARAGGCRG